MGWADRGCRRTCLATGNFFRRQGDGRDLPFAVGTAGLGPRQSPAVAPGRMIGLRLGLLTGLALLTKSTAVFLLGGAITWFLWGTLQRDQDRGPRLRALAYAVLACIVTAGPWYVHHAPSAIRFALYSSRFNIVAEGQSELKPVWDVWSLF